MLNVTIDPDAIDAELADKNPDEVFGLFVSYHGRAAEFVYRAARCIRHLDDVGYDLSSLNPTTLGFYRKIGSGQLDPVFAWEARLSPHRRRLESLPKRDQERFAKNPMVPVVEGETIRKQNIFEAPKEVIDKVIGPAGVRTEDEQREWEGRQKARAAAREPVRPAPVEKLDQKLSVSMTSAERFALRANAADAAMSDSDYARMLLNRAGAFRRPKT
jgi:hypothetical protein